MDCGFARLGVSSKLAVMHGLLDERGLRDGLTLEFLGQRLIVHESTGSTNDDAWQYLGQPHADGSIVIAEQQTAGKGRLGRSWVSPRGASILCTVLLVDQAQTTFGPSLGLAAAVAVRDAIYKTLGLDSRIKWPNDLLIGGRKVAGILVESRRCGSDTLGFVVGMGINCLQHEAHFPPELRARATSLEMESKHAVDRKTLLRALLVELDYRLAPSQRHDLDAIRTAWLERATSIGQRIHLSHNGLRHSGQVIDIDPMANLVVQLDEGGRRLFSAAETTVVDVP